MRQDALAAVCPGQGGIAVAVVRREPGVPPCLEHCEFQAPAPGQEESTLLASMVRQHALDQLPCSSVIDLNAYSVLLAEAPDVPAAELRAAMRWRIKELIDFPIDDAVIDVFEAPAQRAGGAQRPIYVVVARAAVVRRRIEQLLEAGLRLTVVDIPEFAIRNVAALLPEDVGGVAFVMLGRQRGLIVLTRQSTLYLSRRMEAGAGNLLDRAAETLPAQAEGWLDAIVIEIQRSLDYYESHFSQPPVSGAILAPLGVRIGGLTDYLSSQLGLPVRELDMNEVIDTMTPLAPATQAHCFAAIGAALRVEEEAA
jgi:MSHA biogenesis protein MshI